MITKDQIEASKSKNYAPIVTYLVISLTDLQKIPTGTNVVVPAVATGVHHESNYS